MNKILTQRYELWMFRTDMWKIKRDKNSKYCEFRVSHQKPTVFSTMWKSTFFFLFFVALTLAVKDTEYQDEVPGHEGECLGPDKKFYKLGEKMPADSQKPCAHKICKGSAQPGSVYVEVQKCEKITKTPGCELKADEAKSFPDCCARLECGRN